MYQPYIVPNRSEYIVSVYKDQEMRKLSVDLVQAMSDLAFMPTGKAQDLVFHPEYLYHKCKAN